MNRIYFEVKWNLLKIRHAKVDGEYSRIITVKMLSNGKEIALVFKRIYDTGDISFSSFGEIMVRVTDLSDRGWDGQSISVGEIIDQSFQFYCKRPSATLLDYNSTASTRLAC